MALLESNLKRIILASGSPRRAELLKKIVSEFDIIQSSIDEDAITLTDPEKHVLELSRLKAQDVANKVDQGIVVGADSVVVLEGKILGKPRDEHEAFQMLESLSGKYHQVFTGFTIIQVPSGKTVSDFEVTWVKFRSLQPWEIRRYIEVGNPLDKAGAYGIQDEGALFVERIEGCYYTVMGFPLAKFFIALLPFWETPTM